MNRASDRGPAGAGAPRRRAPKRTDGDAAGKSPAPARDAGKATRAEAPAPREEGRPWRELTFDIWQFVRVMVELEERDRGPGRTLLADWRKPWREVDRRLSRLGREDPDGFSDLMMNHQVRLALRARSQLQELTDAIDAVLAKLDHALEAPSIDPQQAEGIAFERRGLRAFRASALKGRP